MYNYDQMSKKQLVEIASALRKTIESRKEWQVRIGDLVIAPPKDGRLDAPYYIVHQNGSNIIFGQGTWLIAYDSPTFENDAAFKTLLLAEGFGSGSGYEISLSPDKTALVYHQWTAESAANTGSMTIFEAGTITLGRFHKTSDGIGDMHVELPAGKIVGFTKPQEDDDQ